MNENNIPYMLYLLDKHYKYYIDYSNDKNHNQHAQKAFYDGAFMMLEVALSDNYQNHTYIGRDEHGKHYIFSPDLPF